MRNVMSLNVISRSVLYEPSDYHPTTILCTWHSFVCRRCELYYHPSNEAADAGIVQAVTLANAAAETSLNQARPTGLFLCLLLCLVNAKVEQEE